MPIGKNAIKRISNNGYSNVQTNAPDMENSEVIEKVEIKKETPEKKKVSSTKTTQKTTTPKKTNKKNTSPKKSMETEPDLAPVNTLKKVVEKTDKTTETTERQGDGYVNVGGKLPDHLL